MNNQVLIIFIIMFLLGTVLGLKSRLPSTRRLMNIHMSVSEITSGMIDLQ